MIVLFNPRFLPRFLPCLFDRLNMAQTCRAGRLAYSNEADQHKRRCLFDPFEWKWTVETFLGGTLVEDQWEIRTWEGIMTSMLCFTSPPSFDLSSFYGVISNETILSALCGCGGDHECVADRSHYFKWKLDAGRITRHIHYPLMRLLQWESKRERKCFDQMNNVLIFYLLYSVRARFLNALSAS